MEGGRRSEGRTNRNPLASLGLAGDQKNPYPMRSRPPLRFPLLVLNWPKRYSKREFVKIFARFSNLSGKNLDKCREEGIFWLRIDYLCWPRID